MVEADKPQVQVQLARQPVFNERLEVHSYELLYRGSADAQSSTRDDLGATCAVLANTYLNIGETALLSGKRALINVPGEMLLDDRITLLPPDRVVLEILETASARDVMDACQRLKAKGFLLAADDYAGEPDRDPLIEIVDWIKVDWLKATAPVRERVVSRFSRPGKILLAEKLETQAEFELAKRLGYQLFQGYFLCRPVLLQGKRLPAGKMHCVRLLQALAQPELDLAWVEQLIRHDPGLCFRLLRWVNSAASERRHAAKTVRDALVWMGEQDLRRWIAIFVTAELASGAPAELLRYAVIRARFCELLAGKLTHSSEQAFLSGMFSLLEAILKRPFDELAAELKLPEEIVRAVQGQGTAGKVLGLVTAYEAGKFGDTQSMAARLGVPAEDISKCYIDSVLWAAKDK